MQDGGLIVPSYMDGNQGHGMVGHMHHPGMGLEAGMQRSLQQGPDEQYEDDLEDAIEPGQEEPDPG